LTTQLNRRRALGLGAVTAAAAVVGTGSAAAAAPEADPAAHEPTPTTPAAAARRVGQTYRRASRRAGGTWNSYVTVADPSGPLQVAVDEAPDVLVQAYSVNKIAVATAVLDKIDRGLLTIEQTVEVDRAIVSFDGDGIFGLDRGYPSTVTLGHVMAAMLTISDNTAVRLCSRVCPALEVNEILVAKGFPKTQVTPSTTNPGRFFLGKTTPRETHDMLQALVNGTLLSPSSTDYLLTALRAQTAFTDGIRRDMSSDERSRIGTKAGWFADGRNEAGLIFDKAGKPVLTYSIFAYGQAEPDNFGSTHPAVLARATMGRKFIDAVDRLTGVAPRAMRAPAYRPSNGG